MLGTAIIAGKYAYNYDEATEAHKYPKFYLVQVDDGVLLVVAGMLLPMCTINVSMSARNPGLEPLRKCMT